MTLRTGTDTGPKPRPSPWELAVAPPPDQWDDWTEYDAKAWPRKVERRYMLVPTICFNCEAACGLLAYVDKDSMRVRKFEGNPLHPASRGRNCAKGPATINQINDPERILYPLRRDGPQGFLTGSLARSAACDDHAPPVGYAVRREGQPSTSSSSSRRMYRVARNAEEHPQAVRPHGGTQ